jgi:hypothetical protein
MESAGNARNAHWDEIVLLTKMETACRQQDSSPYAKSPTGTFRPTAVCPLCGQDKSSGGTWIPRLWTANQGVLGDNCAIASSPLLLRSSTLAWPHASVTAGDAVIVPEVSEQLFDYRGTVGALFGFNGLSGYC